MVVSNESAVSKPMEVLESGTSLAEEEYGTESAPSVNLTRTEIKEGASGSDGIEALRVEIATDVLATGTSVFPFSSPFEIPTDQKKNGHNNITSDRFVQVPLVYCDQTASNRTLSSIEKYMETTCLPYYGNTHTNTSITGAQSTAFVSEARQIVAEGTNARITGKASLDVVLFAGSGTTAAVELLIDCLGLKHACDEEDKRPVVFVGPYEHHSNLVPWRESGCEIVTVPECPKENTVDYTAMEQLLQNPIYNDRLKMGTFTAASNVTGKISDVDRIASILHRHGALAFFDYATGAPYMSMDMNPSPSEEYPSPSLVAKDAIFFSPHKMIGGVGTPGVLVMKKHLINQENAPSRSGGGTVFYVTNTHHRFLSNRIDRFEGGTPNVAGILRVGLAFLFKRQAEQKYKVLATGTGNDNQQESIPPTLQAYEYSIHRKVATYLKQHAPNLHILGYNGNDDQASHTLPIFSFLIKCGKRFLHYNYVCAILNDVFGIQSRGGCQCAGPYSQRLLGLTKVTDGGSEVPNARNEAIEHALLHFKERAELLRPGYSRLSLPFKGLRNEEVEYVMKALAWTAKNGWALMCNYRCNHRTGEWRHANRQGKPLGRTERKWLSHYAIASVAQSTKMSLNLAPCDMQETLQNALLNADSILFMAKTDKQRIAEAVKMNDVDSSSGGDRLEQLRWYMYPKECASLLAQGVEDVPGTELPELEGGLNPLSFDEPSYRLVENDDMLIDALTATTPPSATNRKRKQNTVVQLPAVLRGDDEMQITDNQQFSFRDGEHQEGEASFTEIELGFGEEELSTQCEVFDQQTGAWLKIEDFIQVTKNPTAAKKPANEQMLIDTPGTNNLPDRNRKQNFVAQPPAVSGVEMQIAENQRFSFRDGEHHEGEASFSEIELGFDEEELSTQCEVFDEQAGAWLKIEDFILAVKKSTAETVSAKKQESNLEHDTANSSAEEKKSDSELSNCSNLASAPTSSTPDTKNEKKKPSRGSTAWGQGSFAQPSTMAISNNILGEQEPLEARAEIQSQANPAKKKPKKNKFKHIQPPPKMMRLITQAVVQWKMLEEGDRLLLGLSGGKDSLSLLHCLMECKRKMPINFEIEVCTIDPMTPSFDPSSLIPYVESLGLKYHFIRDNIVDRANAAGKDGKIVSSLCAFCARMKRGNLYTCARKNNCNKLVLGQHLDDCAESFLMSVMHNGFLRTMKAHYKIDAGDLSVIRPMIYCRESLMTDFAKSANLPIINENCPACFEEPKERARTKKLLAREESLYPHFYDTIRRSLIPLMHDDMASILRGYTEEAVSRSRKEPYNGKNGQSKDESANKSVVQQSAEGQNVAMKSPTQIASDGVMVETKDMLASFSEDQLMMEIAKRKAGRYRQPARKGDSEDPTGQICTLNGGNGSIPCRELME